MTGNQQTTTSLRRSVFAQRLTASGMFTLLAIAGVGAVAPVAAASSMLSLQSATRLALPADADANANSSLTSVSCTTTSMCAAVGFFTDHSSAVRPLIAVEQSGTWTFPASVRLPANKGANLARISCATTKNCTAVGSYIDMSGRSQAAAISETNGVWKSAPIALPINAATNPHAVLDSISCATANNCTAVGNYTDKSAHQQAMVTTRINGTWSRADEITEPPSASASPAAVLDGLSCPTQRNCVAVGYFTDRSALQQAMAIAQINGTWGQARQITPPKNAAKNPNASLFGVSCPRTSSCTAVGYYADNSGHLHGMSATRTNSWSNATGISAPIDAGKNPYAPLDNVVCTSVGKCVAVGYYLDHTARQQATIYLSNKGTWARGTAVFAPSDAGKNPHGVLADVSCAATNHCLGVGDYQDGAAIEHAMISESS